MGTDPSGEQFGHPPFMGAVDRLEVWLDEAQVAWRHQILFGAAR